MAIFVSSLRAFLALIFVANICIPNSYLNAMDNGMGNGMGIEDSDYTQRAHGVAQLAMRAAQQSNLPLPKDLALNHISVFLCPIAKETSKSKKIEALVQAGQCKKALELDPQNIRLQRFAKRAKNLEHRSQKLNNEKRNRRPNKRAKTLIIAFGGGKMSPNDDLFLTRDQALEEYADCDDIPEPAPRNLLGMLENMEDES